MSYPDQLQSRVINKLAVEIKKIDIPTVLDCLRARTALDARVVESILKLTDDDQIETKLLREFSLRASVPSSNFLPSLYLSLLDSCESSYHTARVSFSYDVAKLIRNEGKFETIILLKLVHLVFSLLCFAVHVQNNSQEVQTGMGVSCYRGLQYLIKIYEFQTF